MKKAIDIIFPARGLLLALSLLLLVSVVAGCGVGQSPPAPPPATSTGTGSGVLNLYGIDPITLDPAVAGEATSNNYIMQIFSGLVHLDDNLEPVADIAESWRVSRDGLTYTFRIRSNAKFQDGRQVTAADIKYSWERACDPALGSQTAGTYLGDIVGAKDMLAGKARELAGVKAIDDSTLEVTIDAPKSYFLAKLTYPTAFAVDRNNTASGKEWWRKPNGTGAFKLKEWQQNTSLVLERNAFSYAPAQLAAVNFQFYSGVPMNLYETGKIDATSASFDYVDKVTDPASPFSRELTIVPELSLSYIGFNTTHPPFDDANIRRAFTQAIDRERLADLVFRGTAQAAHGILPPGIPGYNKDLGGLKYDVNAARELIRQSRYGRAAALPPITITIMGRGGGAPRELEAIIYEWRQNLGVDVKVRQLEPERYLYFLKQEKDEMFMMGWIADYPHPQDFLEILFGTGTDNNYGEYSNREVDDLLRQAAVEPDTNKSLALYQQAEQKLVTDAACLPLWSGKNYVLVKPYVNGYVVNPLGYAVLGRVSIKGR